MSIPVNESETITPAVPERIDLHPPASRAARQLLGDRQRSAGAVSRTFAMVASSSRGRSQSSPRRNAPSVFGVKSFTAAESNTVESGVSRRNNEHVSPRFVTGHNLLTLRTPAVLMAPGSSYVRGEKNAVNRARLLSEMASRTSKAETSSIAGAAAAPARTMQPLAAERERLMKSPAFLDKKHKDHKATLEAYENVTQKLYGGGPA